MIRALYTAASAMLFGMRQQDVAADNLANSSTAGFKSETSAGSAFAGVLARRVGVAQAPVPVDAEEVLGRIGTGVYQSVRGNDFAVGTLRQTGLTLDVALSGPGFLAIETPEGVQYTRDGRMGRNAENILVNAQGYAVLDAGGQPITLENDRVRFTQTGEVLVDNQPVATLQVVALDQTKAVRAGQTRFSVPDGEVTPITLGAETTVRQGMLEEANVNAAKTTASVITLARNFEASQRIFSMVNETLEKTVNDIGRVA